MQFPDRFADLAEYPFPRLRALLTGQTPGGPEFLMTIGEPKHALPDFVGPVVAEHAEGFRGYPPNEGIPELREAIAGWLERRYGVSVSPETQVITLNGTREGLFNAALAVSPENKNSRRPAIIIPNPYYPCYGAAALASGAEPVPVSAMPETGFLPDFETLDREILDRTTLAYVCSPSNPQGGVADEAYWRRLFALAEKHDFMVLADECYAEIYRDTPPMGALEAAKASGFDPERLLVFHSLSKRSNAAGLRSGFVAGGEKTIKEFKRVRSYFCAPQPKPLQYAAAALWNDEAHVEENRRLYREKFGIADRVFAGFEGYQPPQAGFFLWLPVWDSEVATLEIYRKTGIQVLPGAYLSRQSWDGSDPGEGFIRVALVSGADEVEQGLEKIRSVLDEGINEQG